MIHYLSLGIVLGLSAGIAPGPLLTLVAAETIRYGIKAGIKVAISPLITDLPIIVLSVYVLSQLSNFHSILGIISLIGGTMVLIMGIQRLKTYDLKLDFQGVKSRSMAKGILVNFLSPHPYLFWLSIGAPTITRAKQENILAAAAFLISFYFLLVGSKIVLAILVGKSRSVLKSSVYSYIMKFLGLALCVLAFFLFKDGFSLLGML